MQRAYDDATEQQVRDTITLGIKRLQKLDSKKERFKAACVDVDVLTLSATPIPRTLGAALAGLRDTSELPEAPPGLGEASPSAKKAAQGLMSSSLVCSVSDRLFAPVSPEGTAVGGKNGKPYFASKFCGSISYLR